MLQPNATLYLKNIDWKIKKGLLRRALYSLFSRHGKVLEIIAIRKDGLRGQAFVVMDDVKSATAALQAEQGFTFFGKDLVIEYAKEKSDRISRRDGTYVPKSKRRKAEKIEDYDTENRMDSNTEGNEVKKDESDSQDVKKEETVVDLGPPTKIVLAQNLPAECNEMMLGMLFQQYTGYKEVRVPRPGLAFIEFEDEPHATLALKGLNGFKLTPKDTLNLVYGKV